MAISQMIGARIHRREDPHLITGGGRFVEDQVRPGTLTMVVVRSPRAHTNLADNLAWDHRNTREDSVKDAFAQAEVAIKERIIQQRLARTPMETRGVVAEYSTFDDQLTMWMGTQNPHLIRLWVSGALGMPETKVRVISHDVGGGFGSKVCAYPEDYLVAAAARLLKRPIRWTETRTESIQTTTHGRGQ